MAFARRLGKIVNLAGKLPIDVMRDTRCYSVSWGISKIADTHQSLLDRQYYPCFDLSCCEAATMLSMKTETPLTMSSLEIAELTGKRHDHVLRDIRKMLQQLYVAAPQIWGTAFIQGPNNSRREVEVANLPRDLTETLITGYSTVLRHKVVVRLRELEAEVAKPVFKVPTTLHGALLLAAELEEQRLALTHQVEVQVHKITEDAPKVEFYENVAVAVGTQPVQDVAKEFGMGSTKFYKLLRDEKILMGHPHQNVPYQKHLDAGHFEVVVNEWKVHETGEVKLKPRSFVTGKGLIYLERRLNKLGHFRKVEEAA